MWSKRRRDNGTEETEGTCMRATKEPFDGSVMGEDYAQEDTPEEVMEPVGRGTCMRCSQEVKICDYSYACAIKNNF